MALLHPLWRATSRFYVTWLQTIWTNLKKMYFFKPSRSRLNKGQRSRSFGNFHYFVTLSMWYSWFVKNGNIRFHGNEKPHYEAWEFFHISMFYISANNEHISSKCTPVMHRNMVWIRKNQIILKCQDQHQTHKKPFIICEAPFCFTWRHNITFLQFVLTK